tara:strand:- start:357 stop:746 length:390 start_codon:yes stop_codon:yes gene_type:complete
MIGNDNIWKQLQEIVGAEIKINESPKSIEKREELLFIELLETVETAWNRDNELYEKFGVDLSEHVQYLYHAIETLIMIKYGAFKADIFWWYTLERFDDDGHLLGLENEDGKIYSFKTHKQFYKFFKSIK